MQEKSAGISTRRDIPSECAFVSTDAPSPTPKNIDIELGDEPPHNNQVVLPGLIATVFLCMSSYARNERSNILQVTEG